MTNMIRTSARLPTAAAPFLSRFAIACEWQRPVQAARTQKNADLKGRRKNLLAFIGGNASDRELRSIAARA
jgi:hypothetical protein